MLQHGETPLSKGPVDHAGLTEAAASDASSLDLQDTPVLGHLNIRNNLFFRVESVGEIPLHFLQYSGRGLLEIPKI